MALTYFRSLIVWQAGPNNWAAVWVEMKCRLLKSELLPVGFLMRWRKKKNLCIFRNHSTKQWPVKKHTSTCWRKSEITAWVAAADKAEPRGLCKQTSVPFCSHTHARTHARSHTHTGRLHLEKCRRVKSCAETGVVIGSPTSGQGHNQDKVTQQAKWLTTICRTLSAQESAGEGDSAEGGTEKTEAGWGALTEGRELGSRTQICPTWKPLTGEAEHWSSVLPCWTSLWRTPEAWILGRFHLIADQ